MRTETKLKESLAAHGNKLVVDEPIEFKSGDVVKVDGEGLLVQRGVVPGTAQVQRGIEGSGASDHEAGADVSVGSAEDFVAGEFGNHAAEKDPVSDLHL